MFLFKMAAKIYINVPELDQKWPDADSVLN